MSVLTDILDWSSDRPAWQRDALRRIITQESLSHEDIAELTRICLANHGIIEPDNPPPESNPFSAEHLPQSESEVEQVQFVGLRDVFGVNALAPEQQLHFEINGMTIIFGYNGSGKSGYARILRSLCHARHRGERILPNAYAEGDQPTPTATIEFRVAGENHIETWKQGQNPPAELGRVSFFDADCAAVHVDDENEVAFTPFGLDVLPKLVTVFRKANDSISELIRNQENQQPDSLKNPKAAEGTIVRTMIDKLEHNSNIEAFPQMAELNEDERERIVELQEAFSSDPAARARELRNNVTRLRRLQQNLREAANTLTTELIENIRIKLQDVITKKAAAKAAAEDAFSGQPLSGVGEEVWQELWEAARRYSQQYAFPEQEFPFTENDARCVLCQQLLAQVARDRLTSFENFIKTDTQQAVKIAESDLKNALSELEQLIVGHAAFRDYLPDLQDDQIDLNRSIRRFHRIAWKIKRKILISCAELQWTAPCNLPLDPSTDLDEFIIELIGRSEELKSIANGEERQALINEQDQLLARQWLGSVLEDVEMEITRKKKIVALENALADTATTGITRQSSELTDRYVTSLLRERMTQEIKDLGAGYLPVELDSAGGQLGQKRFRITLQGATGNIAVRQVLSEGEFRCIALAGFLTELSTEQSNSALIFDDPVSSLDHIWRRKVAGRLVQLAQERQVIVFTHDIVFLSDLVRFCDNKGLLLRQSYLFRGVNQPGECIDGVPWAAMKVRDRIGRLKNWHQEAETIHQRQGQEIYEPKARRIYGRLRETWERAVEELLLNGVVIRFDHAIHTQQLNRLADITDGDIQTINSGMTKSSRFLEGHDEAQAVIEPVPDPNELRQDINSLENWVANIRGRR